VAFSSSTAAARLPVTVPPEWDLASLMPDGAVGASAAGRDAVTLAQRFAEHAQYLEHGDSFVDSYLELLAAGGSRSPQQLGEIVGMDLSDLGFWATGLALIDRNLDEAQSTIAAMVS